MEDVVRPKNECFNVESCRLFISWSDKTQSSNSYLLLSWCQWFRFLFLLLLYCVPISWFNIWSHCWQVLMSWSIIISFSCSDVLKCYSSQFALMSWSVIISFRWLFQMIIIVLYLLLLVFFLKIMSDVIPNCRVLLGKNFHSSLLSILRCVHLATAATFSKHFEVFKYFLLNHVGAYT